MNNSTDAVLKRIEINFQKSGMTASEFWAAFASYADTRADEITSARSRRFSRIVKIIDIVEGIVVGCSACAALVCAALV